MKKTWLIKELSQLANVPVATLRYYDEIGLLVPTVRRANGYRVYSSADLLRLQSIVGLKFLGFSLSEVAQILAEKTKLREQFLLQRVLLARKVASLTEILEALDTVLDELQVRRNVSLTTVLTLVEGYRMNQEIEKGWRKICTSAEFKQFEDLKKSHSADQLAKLQHEWRSYLQEAQDYLDADHTSPKSAEFVRQGNALFGRIYESAPKLHAALVRAKKDGTIPSELVPAPIMAWISKVKAAHGID